MTVEIGAVRASASLDSAGVETGVRSARSHLRVLEGGFQKTSREAVRSAEAMGRAWDDGMSRASSATRNQIEALTGLDRASKATSATSKSWVAQLNRQAQSFDRLRASVDPIFGSTKQYESAIKQAERAVQSGIVSQEEANRVLDKAAQKYLGLVPAAQQAAEAQEKVAQQARSAKEAYERTRASLDPLFASSKQYEAVVEQVNAAVKAGVVSQKEAAAVLDKAASQYLGAGAAVSVYGAQAKAGTFQTANLAAQFNDIGVMLAAGQSPLLLAVQQGTQISQVLNQMGGKTDILRGLSAGFLSMINPVSLATIGIIAGGAALFQWGASALGAGENADAFKERVEELEGALAEVDKQLELSEQSFAELRAEFFGSEEGIRSLIRAQRDFDLGKVISEAEALTEALAGSFSASGFLNISRVEKLQAAFGLLGQETRNLAADLNAVGEAEGLEAQLQATRHLREHFLAMVGSQKELTGSRKEFYQTLLLTEAALSRALAKIRDIEGATDDATQAVMRQYELYGSTRNEANALAREIGVAEANALALAGVDITSGVSSAAIEAAKLAASLGVSLNAAINLANLQSSKEYSGRGGDPRKFVDASYQQALGYKSVDEIVKELTKSTKKLGSATQSAMVTLQRDIEQRKKLLGLTGEQRTKYLSLIEVQRRLGKSASKHSKAQIEALADELLMLDRKEEKLRQLEGYARDTADDIASALLDPGSAKDAAKNYVREVAHQFLSQKIVLPVIAQLVGVDGISGVATQAVGGATGGAGGGGLLSGVLNAGGTLSGAGAGIGSGLMGVLSGGGLGSSFANLGGLLSGASAGWGALGAALPAIGIIAAGVAVLVKGFSRKYKGSGIGGAFTPDGLVGGHKFDFYKGGWFRSDKWDRKDLEHEFQSALDDAMISLSDGVVGMADTLNLGTKALKNFEQENFTIWTNGKSQEEIQQALQGEMQKTAEQMAELILKNEDYLRIGETHLEALTRLSTGLLAVNDAMDILGQTAFEASLKGGDAASHLVDEFGNVEAMAGAVSAYWNGFYTEAERQETTVRRLQQQFEALGTSMPESRAGFRELVEGIDLTSASGRELYADLLELSAGLDAVLPKVGAYTEAMQGMVDQIGGEIGSQISSARDMARISEQSAQLWYRTATTLRDFLSDLLNTDLTAASRFQAATVNRGRFETAFDLARGGDVQAARDMPALAKAYLQSARATAATSLEYRRIAAQVQGQVNFLAGIADLEGANDDVLRGLYEQQIEVLTGLGNFLQLEGLTSDQVAELGDGVQALTENWDGTVEAFEGSLGALEDAIRNAEAFSYDDLVGRLDVAVSLADHAPRWVQRLVDSADTGLRTTLDFVIRNDELSPADKWIATNAASEHVSALDFVLRSDLDRATRKLVLETAGELQRDLNLTLAEDLDADTRQILLTRNASLTRRVNVALEGDSSKAIDRINRLQDLIGTKGSGKITFDGGLKLTADEAFKGLSDGVQDLVSPINKLRGMLGELRDAVDADRQQRETTLKIAGLQVKGADAVARTQQAQGVVDDFNALRREYGITLTGQKGTVSVNDAGRIVTSFDYYGGGDVVGFKKALRKEFGTDAIGSVFSKTNSRVGSAEDRAAALRQQIIDLGGIPAFARGGTHRGGFAHVGENDIELVAPSRIYNPADTRAMLDNRGVVKELSELRRELASLRSEQRQLGLQTVANTKKSASNTRVLAQDKLSAGSS